jgi:hypothetical protein
MSSRPLIQAARKECSLATSPETIDLSICSRDAALSPALIAYSEAKASLSVFFGTNPHLLALVCPEQGKKHPPA